MCVYLTGTDTIQQRACDHGHYWWGPIANCSCEANPVAHFSVYRYRRRVHSPSIAQSEQRHAARCVRAECSCADIIRVRTVALDLAMGQRQQDLDLGGTSELVDLVPVCGMGVVWIVRLDHDQDVQAI